MGKLDLRFQQLFKKYKPYTMIPELYYKTNLGIAFNYKDINGSVVECGTWKGGMIAGMADIIGDSKDYHLFDSYEGLPPPTDNDGEEAVKWQVNKEGKFYFDNCTAQESDAIEAMGLSLVTEYTTHKGWFKDTVSTVRFNNGISILRLDGDWYDSTMQCLDALFHQVNKGGVIIIDDYFAWEGCSKAVHDFLSKNNCVERIRTDGGVCKIIKGESFSFN